MFRWLWNMMDRNIPEGDDNGVVTMPAPLTQSPPSDAGLLGIIENALCEIATYDDSIQLKLAWSDNSTQDGCYVAGFVYDYSPGEFIFDPVNGEQPLMAVGGTPEDAMAEFRKVLLPFFVPPDGRAAPRGDKL